MVRPRASESNIRIALVFAEIVTVQTRPGAPNDPSTVLVARKGRQSIFAAFAACLPGLARDSREKRPKNRHGVALMELNKALQTAGLKSVRKRDRIDGGVRWRSKASLTFGPFLCPICFQNMVNCTPTHGGPLLSSFGRTAGGRIRQTRGISAPWPRS
jgi:hypothetical protein